jgi:hypothetical protein
MMSRRIFGEFMRFFSKGLNPFKIQASFQFGNSLTIYNSWIWTHSHNERCSFSIYLPLCQVWKFLEFCNYQFETLQVWIIWILEKNLRINKKVFNQVWPTQLCSPPRLEPAQITNRHFGWAEAHPAKRPCARPTSSSSPPDRAGRVTAFLRLGTTHSFATQLVRFQLATSNKSSWDFNLLNSFSVSRIVKSVNFSKAVIFISQAESSRTYSSCLTHSLSE